MTKAREISLMIMLHTAEETKICSAETTALNFFIPLILLLHFASFDALHNVKHSISTQTAAPVLMWFCCLKDFKFFFLTVTNVFI